MSNNLIIVFVIKTNCFLIKNKKNKIKNKKKNTKKLPRNYFIRKRQIHFKHNFFSLSLSTYITTTEKSRQHQRHLVKIFIENFPKKKINKI